MTKEQQAVIDNAKAVRDTAIETELHNKYLARSRIEDILDLKKSNDLNTLEC